MTDGNAAAPVDVVSDDSPEPQFVCAMLGVFMCSVPKDKTITINPNNPPVESFLLPPSSRRIYAGEVQTLAR